MTINFRNDDPNIAHSIGVDSRTGNFPATFQDPEAVFAGAISGAATSMQEATQPGESESFSFTADAAGEYSLICYIPAHAAVGMWIRFHVSAKGLAGLLRPSSPTAIAGVPEKPPAAPKATSYVTNAGYAACVVKSDFLALGALVEGGYQAEAKRFISERLVSGTPCLITGNGVSVVVIGLADAPIIRIRPVGETTSFYTQRQAIRRR